MLTFRDDAVKDEILKDTGLRPSFALEAFQDLDGDVRQSMARIRASWFVLHKDGIRGFVYDVKTGKLREVVSHESFVDSGPAGPSRSNVNG